jgi:ABC-type dipeptide/oligopeptide/nickel transport system permease subunit
MTEEILETPQPMQPTETKTTNWPKIILAAVLGFVLLAASAYAGYWYGTQETSNLKNQISKLEFKPQNYPTSSPTSIPTPIVEDEKVDWKTYTNSAYGFSFSYPSDSELYENTEKVGTEELRIVLWLKGIDDPIVLTVNGYDYQHACADIGKSNPLPKVINKLVWDTSYSQASGPEETLTPEYCYETIDNNERFYFGTTERGRDFLERILSTFKFLD